MSIVEAVVVGAGPYGLSVAAHLRAANCVQFSDATGRYTGPLRCRSWQGAEGQGAAEGRHFVDLRYLERNTIDISNWDTKLDLSGNLIDLPEKN
jgi:hypothetical protein